MSTQKLGPVVFKVSTIPCLVTKCSPGVQGGFTSGALATEVLPNADLPDGLPPHPTFSFPAGSACFASGWGISRTKGSPAGQQLSVSVRPVEWDKQAWRGNGMLLVMWTCNFKGRIWHMQPAERCEKAKQPDRLVVWSPSSLGRPVLQQATISLHITRQGSMRSHPFPLQIFSVVICSWFPTPQKKHPKSLKCSFHLSLSLSLFFPVPLVMQNPSKKPQTPLNHTQACEQHKGAINIISRKH